MYSLEITMDHISDMQCTNLEVIDVALILRFLAPGPKSVSRAVEVDGASLKHSAFQKQIDFPALRQH